MDRRDQAFEGTPLKRYVRKEFEEERYSRLNSLSLASGFLFLSTSGELGEDVEVVSLVIGYVIWIESTTKKNSLAANSRDSKKDKERSDEETLIISWSVRKGLSCVGYWDLSTGHVIKYKSV